ncbi:galaxin-like [Carassius carassius]|uniref:galaxin-like n=1 Tax=Carassius carassius TaxID=217509 RepID=UPI0028684034|nr:galaxin-like [Carassius carassius]
MSKLDTSGAAQLITVLLSFATSSAKGSHHHDRGTHNASFNEQMESISKNHLHWCGNVSYKISGSSCCNGNINLGLSQLVADCCGSVAYNPLNEICCNGNILTRSSTYEKCCGKDLYLTTTHMCCGSNKIFQQKENLSCCGTKTFDKTTHCCCADPALVVKPKHETCCQKATGVYVYSSYSDC